MTAQERLCRSCHQSKLPEEFPKNRPDGSRHLRCLTCQAKAYKARYHQDDRRRAFQIAYSMNGSVERRFPLWSRLPPAQLVAVILETRSCRYCGLPNDGSGRGFQLDHIVPLSRGGPHHLDNIALCCDRCNRAKWDSTESEYLNWLQETVQRLACSGH